MSPRVSVHVAHGSSQHAEHGGILVHQLVPVLGHCCIGSQQFGEAVIRFNSQIFASLGEGCVEERLQQAVVDEDDVASHAFLDDETGIGEVCQPKCSRLPLSKACVDDVVDS